MLRPDKKDPQGSLFFSLADTLDQRHPLYILSSKVDWQIFEREFSPLYCADNGAPAKPIRLMVGLLILKYIRDLSDESLVEQRSENNYYQYFCGQRDFTPSQPCASSELVYFRHRIGIQGCELILKESIRITGRDGDQGDPSANATVQEKNITYPTDNKLHRKIIKRCHRIASEERIELRQSYRRTLKRLAVDQRFGSHPRNRKKALKANRKVKTIAGRLVRELDRKLPQEHSHGEFLSVSIRILQQNRGDKHKIYSVHEPHFRPNKEKSYFRFGWQLSFSGMTNY